MVETGSFASSLNKERRKFRVDFAPKVDWESLPYEVVVDSDRVGRVLSEVGLDSEEIDKHKLIVSDGGGVCGRYSRDERTIILNIGAVLQAATKYGKVAEQIHSGQIKPKKQFKRLLYTKRLENYLQNVEGPRGTVFARKLILNGANRIANHTLHHEICHAAESKESFSKRMHRRLAMLGVSSIGLSAYVVVENYRYGFNYWGGVLTITAAAIGAISGVVANDFIDPIERDARVFARNHSGDPKWRNLVSLVPREASLPSTQ
ncbi:MAG: hypothetical protein AAB512_04870 [Patescibacteria group bacterium]